MEEIPVSAPVMDTVGLTVAVPGRVLIREFSLRIAAGQFCALLGGNGTGKSLLLRTLAGLRTPDHGTVRIGGAEIRTLPRRAVARMLGFLPQDPDAAPQGILRESVLLGRFAHLELLQAPGAGDHERVREALAHVGLSRLAGRELATLSGGEQRRAAIARLLVQAPRIYLLDEPTNHLDPAQQLAILERLRELTRSGAAVVASLHDPNLALRFADDVCLLSGDGAAALMPRDALDAGQLSRLYEVPFAEGCIGQHRVVTAA